MRRQHTYPPKLNSEGNKSDVDALDALEIPRGDKGTVYLLRQFWG